MPTTDPETVSRRRGFDASDITGLALIGWLGLWLGAAATRGGTAIVPALSSVLVATAAYVLARWSRRRGPWQAPLAVALAVATVGVLDLGSVYDPLTGPLGYANATAAFFLLGAVHAGVVAVRAPVRPLRIVGGLLAVAFVSVPWLNASRTGAILSLALLLPWLVRRPNALAVRVLAATTAVVVLGVIGTTTVLGAVYEEPAERSPAGRLIDATVSERRLELWRDAVELTARDPLRGVGLGRFAETSPTAIIHPEQPWAHHAYLQVGAEAGVPAMVLLIGLVIWGFGSIAARAEDGNALWVLVGWGAVATHASLDYVLAFPAIIALAAALLGSVSGHRSVPPEPGRSVAATRHERARRASRPRTSRDIHPSAEVASGGHLSLFGSAPGSHALRREALTVQDVGPGQDQEAPMGERQPSDGVRDEDRLDAPSPADLLARRILPRVRAAAVRMRLDYALVALDATLVVAAYGAALLLRFDGVVPEPFASRAPRLFAMAVVAHLVTNFIAGLYGHVWQQASIDEARRVVVANAMAAAWVLAWVSSLPSERAPRSVAITGGAIAMLLTGVVRFRTRLFAFQIGRSATRPPHAPDRVIVVGSGAAARSVITEMRESDTSDYRPVAIIDPDRSHHGRTILGLPIAGDVDELAEVARDHRADLVLIADPEADRGYVEDVTATARSSGLEVKVLPNVTELMGQPATVRDVRDLAIADLLGRTPIPTDLASIRGIIAGRRVLVTGGGGSIGSELARQIAACDPARLVLLDHDETHLHDAVARLDGAAVQVLADIRDASLLDRVMGDHRPHVIFHAAAHKHVPILEGHPSEAVATNVVGTQNLIRSARMFDVERFVFISTDKAVHPRSVMGATKRLGEQLVLHADRSSDVRFCAVRFGNVLGSRGSVIPTFVDQIRRGGPVTVTHPDMTRFFMTIPEAAQLVLQAAAFSEGGEIFMLDMGEPVRIVDLAHRMIRLSGRRPEVDVTIEFTGLRPGEKLEEELAASDEEAHPTAHPSISALEPALLDARHLSSGIETLRTLAEGHADDVVVPVLFGLAEPGQDTVVVLPDHEPAIRLPLVRLREARS